MAENSKIEWTDHTVNLWWGCSKVHTGCKNCYAEHLSDTRYKNNLWGNKSPRKMIKSAFKDLNRYQKQAQEAGIKVRVFMGSMMDIFEDSKLLVDHNGQPVYIDPNHPQLETANLRSKLFENIYYNRYPNLVFLFLTKRPENIGDMIPRAWVLKHPENVWFGTSVSDQQTTWAIWALKQYTVPEANRFLSIEPQVQHVSLPFTDGIHWIIQGGESGPNKRPFDIEWAYSMRDQCKENGIPYFFKQIDKVQLIPEDLQIRELPNF